MAACTALSAAAVRGLRLVPYEPLRSARHTRRVALLSAVFCASVVAGNVSLRFIPVSFNQAVSATDPAFTALFAAALLRKREARATYLALVPIIAGTALASGVRRGARSVHARRLLTLHPACEPQFEPSFDGLGFGMCLAAAAARALKSVMQEALLSDGCASFQQDWFCQASYTYSSANLCLQRRERMHSLNLLSHMAPMALLMLLPLVLLLERDAATAAADAIASQPGFAAALALNCCAAAGVNLANFLVTRATSALTLQVLGKAKSVVAVAVSLALFRNPVSALGLAGYGLCLAGVAAYGRAKAAAGDGRASPAAAADDLLLPTTMPTKRASQVL